MPRLSANHFESDSRGPIRIAEIEGIVSRISSSWEFSRTFVRGLEPSLGHRTGALWYTRAEKKVKETETSSA